MKNKTAYIIIALLLIIAGLITGIALRPSIPPVTRTQVRIIEAKKDSIVTTARAKSKLNVTRAQVLKKSLPREEPKITDTTYAAMCEYITNYRTSATIDAEP